ncbi:MAG: Manganese transport system ATP-binding protein MntB [Chlamydiae bacterium]|nr:Manganese transport system ATP-binding protein MntB [Chlamydiota bacterium]
MNLNLPPALKVDHLTVNYDQVAVLWDITFSVPQGQLVAIIGPNGAGKSTFLKSILGLTKSLSGQVEILGNSWKKQLCKTAYLPQRECIDWNFPITVEELVLQGRYPKLGLFKWIRQSDRAACFEALKWVDMLDYRHRQISQLSIGQQQRIFLARALLQDADLYFMDEPFSGVDSVTEKFIFKFLKRLKAKGKTLFVIHHDLQSIAKHFDWVIMLNVRLIASGPVSTHFTRENLDQTFGHHTHLFEEVFNLSHKKNLGVDPT